MVASRTRPGIATAADRALTELDFQRMLVGTKPPGLAVIYGWEHVHFRAAMTKHGFRVPGSGSMAEGWPDLVLVRPRDRRLVFAELKREGQKPTPAQERVLLWLLSLQATDAHELNRLSAIPTVEVHVWRPSDLSSGRIEEVLR
jgi:hypothetical protein